VSRRASLLALLVWALGLALPELAAAQSAPPPGSTGTERRLELRLKPLPDGVRRVSLEAASDGRSVVVLERVDGTQQRVTPDALARVLLDEGRHRGLLYRLLNITGAAGMLWVGLGLLGQVLFTGRMLLQWFVSERERRSVVPVGFWWMSLVGATMLLAYFV
jgi:hypothetical protein